jgi:hypothetical protein
MVRSFEIAYDTKFCLTNNHDDKNKKLSSFMKIIFVISLIRRTACGLAQFSGCSSTTNAHSETGQMSVCCQNLPLGAFSSHSAPSALVGELFKKFGLFLNTRRFRKMR